MPASSLIRSLCCSTIVLLLLAGCGGGGRGDATTTASPPPGATTPAVPAVATLGRGLSIGVAEINPAVLAPPGSGPHVDPAFAPWRRRLTELRPALYRLVIDWSSLQPSPDAPAQLDKAVDGCSRGTPPCGAYAGVQATLRALAAQQRRGGFATLVTFHGVPDWAADAPSGCESPGTQSRSRPIAAIGLKGYAALVRQVAALARAEGATISWWSPWNEPNGGFFISPQRARCSSSAPPASTAVYARLVRTMRSALSEVPGSHALVVGELAGVAHAGPHGTGSGEFLRHLPDDVACGATAVTQHLYAHLPGQKLSSGDPVTATKAAMDARPCLRRTPMWITETGVGGLHVNEVRDTSAASLREQCRVYARQLRRFAADRRIQAAFQYSIREDVAFPVGLFDAGLTRAYPTYDLLAAWAHRPSPDSPAPALPASCRE